MRTASSRSNQESNKMTLNIKNLHVEIEKKEILKGVNLNLEKGKIHVLMGPNGSGKSTLANAIMGHPKYIITSGEILLDGKDITKESAEKRAKKGLFLSFQYPQEVSGVTIRKFLNQAYNSVKKKKITIFKFKDLIERKIQELDMDPKFLERYLNEGFSGGEKKKSEILQMMVLDPKIAILDETDSGLDIDALKEVAKGVNNFMNEEKIVLIITHYKRILNHIKPDKIYVMMDGKIVAEGGEELVDKLEREGYKGIIAPKIQEAV